LGPLPRSPVLVSFGLGGPSNGPGSVGQSARRPALSRGLERPEGDRPSAPHHQSTIVPRYKGERGTVGHTGTEPRGDRRAPTGQCEVGGYPPGGSKSLPG